MTLILFTYIMFENYFDNTLVYFNHHLPLPPQLPYSNFSSELTLRKPHHTVARTTIQFAHIITFGIRAFCCTNQDYIPDQSKTT